MKLRNENAHVTGVLPNDASRVGFYLEAGILAEFTRREEARKRQPKPSALDKELPGFAPFHPTGEMNVPIAQLQGGYVDDLEERLGVEWGEVSDPLFAEREWVVTVFGEVYSYRLSTIHSALPEFDGKLTYEWEGHEWEGAQGHK